MSMRMYLLRGDEATLSRLASEPGALSALAMASASNAAASEPPILRHAEELERQLRELEHRARGRGLISVVDTFFRRRSMRRTIDRMRAISREMRRPATASATPLELRNSWHVLHHLITEATGRPDGAAATLLSGGQPIGEGLGHGPARLVDPVATRDFAHVLSAVTVEDLQSRIDIARLMRLGICGVDDKLNGMLIRTVRDDFPTLRSYVEAAAVKGDGLLIWMK